MKPRNYTTMLSSALFFASHLLLGVGAFLVYPTFYVETWMEHGLNEACGKALLTDIDCDSNLNGMGRTGWQGLLRGDDDFTITDSICAPKCGESLQEWSKALSENCDPRSFSPITLVEGRIQLCDKDEKTGEYCNGKHSRRSSNRRSMLTYHSKLSLMRFRTYATMKSWSPRTFASHAMSDVCGGLISAIIVLPTAGSNVLVTVWTSIVPSLSWPRRVQPWFKTCRLQQQPLHRILRQSQRRSQLRKALSRPQTPLHRQQPRHWKRSLLQWSLMQVRGLVMGKLKYICLSPWFWQ